MMELSQNQLQLKVKYNRIVFDDKYIIQQLQNEQSFISNLSFTNLILDQTGSIQDYEDKLECIQADFADKYIGGGVLNKGCVQEEIMFIIAPELIPSILFCERLDDNEVVQITGAQRYSNYTGFGPTFSFKSNHISSVKSKIVLLNDVSLQNYDNNDKCNQEQQEQQDNKEDNYILTHFALFDAKNFRNKENEQYEQQSILRELLKSYYAFNHFQGVFKLFNNNQHDITEIKHNNNNNDNQNQININENKIINIPIVSGNWGCGVYKGDVQFKLIIQWISASMLQKDIYYCTFGHPKLLQAQQIIELIKSKTIYQIYQIIGQYYQNLQYYDFFTFLISKLSN